jgi:hypothetical protein
MTPDRAERAVDAAFGPGAWAEAGEHIDRNAEIAARFDVAIAQLGLRATHPGRPLTMAEDEAADRAAQRILDDYFEPKDY